MRQGYVKITIKLPDELVRRAKVEAKLRKRKFKDLVDEGLALVLHGPSSEIGRTRLGELMSPACGIVDSGLPDLASSARHLKGFGQKVQVTK
jgi:hypothetical protein